MSDIFREVDEALRRERLDRIWRGYALFGAVGLAVLVLGFGGYGWWQSRADARQEAASSALDDALAKTSPEARLRALESIEGQEGRIYGIFAEFHRAAALSEMDEWREAGDIYTELAQARRVPQPLRDLARLKGGTLLAGRADVEEVISLLAPATDSSGYFRASAREVLALVALQAGEIELARENLQQIADDAQSPGATRVRARALLQDRFGAPAASDLPEAPPTAPESEAEETPEVESGT